MKNLTHIEGRRWFQRSYGNTYHTTTLHFDDGTSETSEITYGYDEGYLQTAIDILVKLGDMHNLRRIARLIDINNDKKPLWCYEWQAMKSNGVTTSASDVNRQKDL